MKKLSRPDFVRHLESEGLKFSELVLSSEGNYAAEDSDWNYKDIPHLHCVHELAESIPAVISDDVICSINMQRILGIWFPVALVNYEYQKYHQVYYTTTLFYALIIETKTDEYAPLKTRVTTTYSIGSPSWLTWTHGLIKWLIRHNYKNLMSTDIPMRERRGELRKLGYSFQKTGETYSFIETLNISKKNTILPPNAVRHISCNYVSLLEKSNDVLVGDTGLLGFRLLRNGNNITLLPRSCPHEGACVEKMDFSKGAVVCPWHGRRLTPIGTFVWKQDTSFSKDDYNVQITGDIITVEYVGDEGESHSNVAA